MINDIITGLRTVNQQALDAKLYAISESQLESLGIDNNLAYTYYKGMRVYCANERTIWEWREPNILGEIGKLTSNFIYPAGLIISGIDYGNKEYNFFKVLTPEDVVDGLQTYQVANIPGLGQGLYRDTTTPALNTKQFNFKRLISNNLTITATDE